MSLLPAPIERRDLLARALDRVVRVPPEPMLLARRVAELLGEERQHRLEHTRIDRGRRVVIEINHFNPSLRSRSGPQDPLRPSSLFSPTGGTNTIRDTVCVGAGARRIRVRRHLRDAHRVQRIEDAVLDLPERVANAALRVLVAVVIVVRARGHRDRTIHGLDHVRH